MYVDISEVLVISQTMATDDLMSKAKHFVQKNAIAIGVAALVLFIVILVFSLKSNFADFNEINRHIVGGQDEMSLDDKINAAVRGKSSLTGTRDIPVFFQNYNLEAQRDETTGDIVAAHSEGLAGSKDEIDEIEKKFMLIK